MLPSRLQQGGGGGSSITGQAREAPVASRLETKCIRRAMQKFQAHLGAEPPAAWGRPGVKMSTSTQGSPFPTSLFANVGRMKWGHHEKLHFYLSGAWCGAVSEAAQPGWQTGYYSQTKNYPLKISSKAALLQKQPCPGLAIGSSSSCLGLDPDISISSVQENRSKDKDESKQAYPYPPQFPLHPP